MKKLLFIAAVFIFTLMSSAALAVDKDLIAGQYYDIGTVRVTNDETNLYVEYILDGDCEVWGDLSETHLHVSTIAPVAGAADPPAIPQNKKGNPKIGNFQYSGALSYTIPLASIPATLGQMLYIAAHAGGPGWDELAAILPDEVELTISGYGTGPYLDIVISNDGILDGPHTAWCLDVYDEVFVNEDLVAFVYLNDVYPEINWLLNNYMNYIGQTSNQGDPFVPGDIQAAIWLMTSGMPAYGDPGWSAYAWGLNTWGDWADEDVVPPVPGVGYDEDEYNDDVARAQELVNDAMLYGENFVPSCCQVTGVILLPIDDNTEDDITPQPLLISVPAPCDETAWAAGTQFPIKGKGNGSWAMYFTYTPVAP